MSCQGVLVNFDDLGALFVLEVEQVVLFRDGDRLPLLLEVETQTLGHTERVQQLHTGQA